MIYPQISQINADLGTQLPRIKNHGYRRMKIMNHEKHEKTRKGKPRRLFFVFLAPFAPFAVNLFSLAVNFQKKSEKTEKSEKSNGRQIGSGGKQRGWIPAFSGMTTFLKSEKSDISDPATPCLEYLFYTATLDTFASLRRKSDSREIVRATKEGKAVYIYGEPLGATNRIGGNQ
jgi:hypothetical protein